MEIKKDPIYKEFYRECTYTFNSCSYGRLVITVYPELGYEIKSIYRHDAENIKESFEWIKECVGEAINEQRRLI